MLIDMHTHIFPFSSDSHMYLEDVIARSKELGLDGICITDHDTIDGKDEVEELSLKFNFPIFLGVEILTHEGDVVVFGLDNIPSKKISLSHLLDLVDKVGGVAIPAHPYRRNNRGIGDHIYRYSTRFHGIEVLNGNTRLDRNIKANLTAKNLNLPRIGASDAHHIDEIGRYVTHFDRDVSCVADLICEIKERNFRPATLVGNTYIINKGHELIENKDAGIIKTLNINIG